MADRKKVTAFILKNIEKILPGSGNKEYWEEKLSSMSDKAFGEFMDKLASGDETLFINVPNGAKKKLSVSRNVDHARELGHEIFQHLILTEPNTGTKYKTPKKYMVIDLPVRRQAQMLKKKASIPDGSRRIDELTGQAVKPSTGSRLSFPELQALKAQGLNRSIEELIKFRGGDRKAFAAMSRQISELGEVSQDTIKAAIDSAVTSTQTLSAYLLAMHLDNNLIKRGA